MNFVVYEVLRHERDSKEDDRELVGETSKLNEALAMAQVIEEEHVKIGNEGGFERRCVVIAQMSKREGGKRFQFSGMLYFKDMVELAWRDKYQRENRESHKASVLKNQKDPKVKVVPLDGACVYMERMPLHFRPHRWHGLIQHATEYGQKYSKKAVEGLLCKIRDEREKYTGESVEMEDVTALAGAYDGDDDTTSEDS